MKYQSRPLSQRRPIAQRYIYSYPFCAGLYLALHRTPMSYLATSLRVFVNMDYLSGDDRSYGFSVLSLFQSTPIGIGEIVSVMEIPIVR